MHRTTCKWQSLRWGMLLALLLAGPESGLRAQATPGAALIVPINGTVRLQMSTKKPIRTVINPKDTAISIRTVVGDPTTLLITGQSPDKTRIELVDIDGRRETYEIIVQLDVEYLQAQLRRTVPTANVTPIPTSNNSVILAGTVTKSEDIDIILRVAQSLGGVQVINALRVGGVQQVQLDVVVAKVSRTKLRQMAVNFLSDSKNSFAGSTVGQAVTNPIMAGATSININGTYPGFQTLNGAPGIPNGAPINLFGGIIKNSWGLLFFIQALKDEDVVKYVAEPRLVTTSGRPASFLSGGEQAIPVPAGLGQVGVQFEEFGTRLNFVPIVLGSGRIHLEVEPEVSTLDPGNGTTINGTVVPGRDTDRINTTVELEDGQTFIIGGLIEKRVAATSQFVPILGEIPFLQTLFSSKSYEEDEFETLIVVTVHLVDAQSCDQVVKVMPGEESRSPDDFELFLEGILEAPRGPREVFPGHRYVPAYKNSNTLDLYPCGKDGCMSGGGAGGCATCGARGPVAMTAAPVANPGNAAAVPPKVTRTPVPAATAWSSAPPAAAPAKPAAPAQAPAELPARLPEGLPAKSDATAPRPGVLPPIPGADKTRPTLPPVPGMSETSETDDPSPESLLGPNE